MNLKNVNKKIYYINIYLILYENYLKILISIIFLFNIIYISFLTFEIYNDTIINLEDINSFSFILILKKFKKLYCINDKNILNNIDNSFLVNNKHKFDIEDNKNILNRNVFGSIIGDNGRDIDPDLLYNKICSKINKSLPITHKEYIEILSTYFEEEKEEEDI